MNKIRLLLTSLFTLIVFAGFSQVYLINEIDGTEFTCSGTLYDSGGESGNYGSSESFTSTICSDNGSTLEITFTQFNTQLGNDMLTITDGPNENAPILAGPISGTALQGQTLVSTGNCLTFIWSSSSTGNLTGWAADINCGNQCQGFTIDIINTDPVISDLDSMFIDICPGDEIDFNVQGDYPNNGSEGYSQSDGTTMFHWLVIDENQDTVATEGLGMTNFSETFEEPGGYFVVVYGEDENGCFNMNYQEFRVRVSIPPYFNGTNIQPDPVCPGAEIALDGEVQANDWHAPVPEIAAGETFLPDGNGASYTTCLNYTIFSAGQTVQSAADIENIFINMEHSYLGDLDIEIQCPNGSIAAIKTYPGGGGAYLGEPIDDDSNLDPGVGYEYIFTENSPEHGTLVGEGVGSSSSLPAGSYLPEESFNSLIGCPLNGNWCIVITDNLSIDNGYIFQWGLNFNPDVYPDDFWIIANNFPSSQMTWGGPDMQEQSVGNGIATPFISGDAIAYTFTATDNFGCSYDTTVTVTVLPQDDPTCCIEPTPIIGGDQVICTNSFTLTASAPAPGNDGYWTQLSGPGAAAFSDDTDPNSTVTVPIMGDYEFQWTERYLGNEACSSSVSITISFNQMLNPTITPVADMCLSAAPVELVIQDLGSLSCSACAPGALNDLIIDPEELGPGVYTVINTVSGPCITAPNDQITFEVFDEVEISSFNDQVCLPGSTPEYIVEWTAVSAYDGSPISNYNVDGVAQTSPNFYEQHISGNGYSYNITDNNGCTNTTLAGFRDCDCVSAGTMSSLETVVLCQGESTGSSVVHNEDNTVLGASIFEFMIHNGDNVPLAYSPNEDFELSDFPGVYNTIYYISAITGYDNNGDGHPDFTGCFGISQGTPVMWMLNPIPNAGIDRDTCGQVMILHGNEPAPGMIGYWSSTCDFTPVAGSDIHDPNMTVYSSDWGTCTYTWTIVNGTCQGSDNVIIDFNEIPAPFAGNDTIVCGTSIDLEAFPSVDGTTFQWSGAGVTFNPSNGTETTATVGSPGTYQVTVTEANGACYNQDERNVTFIAGPQPTVIDNVDTTCGINYCFNVQNVQGSGFWTAYDNGVQIFPDFADPNDPATCVTIGNYPDVYRTVEFVWTETNSYQGLECSNSVSQEVVFAKVPNASIMTVDQEECSGEIVLEANTTGSEWADGKWVVKIPIEHEFLPSNTDPNATLHILSDAAYGDSASVEVPIMWQMSVQGGCYATDQTVITFFRTPNANAGLNDSICGLSYPLEAFYSLPDTTNYTAEGYWQNTAGMNPDGSVANFVNTNEAATEVNVNVPGDYYFVWREVNSGNEFCTDRDTVMITFKEIPVIDAGDDFDVCGQSTTLEGVSADFYFNWTTNDPGVAFVDYEDPLTDVNVGNYGDYTFVALESNDECVGRDTVVVTFWRQPDAVQLVDPLDTLVCGRVFDRLRAENPGAGVTGTWVAEPGNGVTFYNNSYDETVEVNNYGYYEFQWVEYTGPVDEGPSFCNDTSEIVPMYFVEIPDANAGLDTVFCGDSGNLNALLSVSGAEGTWTENSGNIDFDDTHDPNTLVTTAVLSNDYEELYFPIIWTENNMTCTNSDTVLVRFEKIPESDIVIVPPKCFGSSAYIKAEQDSLPVYDWTWSGGHIDSTYAPNEQGGVAEYWVSWPNTDDTAHLVTLTVENYYGCRSLLENVMIPEPYLPEISVDAFPDTCALGRGGFEFIADTNTAFPSFSWIDTAGNEIPVPQGDTIFNLEAGTYYGIHNYRTFNSVFIPEYQDLNWGTQCIDTFDFFIDTAGMVYAEIAVSAATDLNSLVAPNAEVWFDNLSDGDDVRTSCTWYFGDGESTNSCDEQMSHVYTEPSDCYKPFFVIKVRNIPECRDTAFLDCIIIDNMSTLEIPNIFTPNGDGMNDFFQVKAETMQSFEGKIVNRWGRTIYEWSDYELEESGWDGKLSGGGEAATGVYYYIIKAQGMDGVEYDEYGPFHLVREK